MGNLMSPDDCNDEPLATDNLFDNDTGRQHICARLQAGTETLVTHHEEHGGEAQH